MADGVIRCQPGEDKTNGFFVACFVKGAVRSAGSVVSGKKGKKRAREEAPVAVAAGLSEGVGAEKAVEVTEGAVLGLEEKSEVVRESKAKTEAQKARKKRKRDNQKARAQGD